MTPEEGPKGKKDFQRLPTGLDAIHQEPCYWRESQLRRFSLLSPPNYRSGSTSVRQSQHVLLKWLFLLFKVTKLTDKFLRVASTNVAGGSSSLSLSALIDGARIDDFCISYASPGANASLASSPATHFGFYELVRSLVYSLSPSPLPILPLFLPFSLSVYKRL